MDRYIPPIFGRRRGWILITQILLILTIALMGFLGPKKSLLIFSIIAVSVAFFSASQDIVIDAYRTEVLSKEELGLGASYYILGYRLAMLVSGALALILADHLPWKNVYLIMSAVMLFGVFATIISPESEVIATPKSLKEAVVMPFIEFFSRTGAIEILIFIIIYKLDVVVATALMTPFLMDIGFTKTDIGVVTKGIGLIATIVGGIVGGMIMTKISLKKALLSFGILQGVSGLSFILLAHFGKSYALLSAVIGLENFFSAMGTTAYSAFLMSLCNKKFTATQYALLSSLMALSRTFLGAPTGLLAKSVGWEAYYIISMLLMLPGLLMLLRFEKWQSIQNT
jgi:PAT family beta-lactamase induction signal transducer AmpG